MAPGGWTVRVAAAIGAEMRVAADSSQRREARPSLRMMMTMMMMMMMMMMWMPKNIRKEKTRARCRRGA